MRLSYALSTALLLSLWLCACDEVKTARFVEPIYTDPCALVNCGLGTCAAMSGAEPECLCEPGYEGVTCASCEPGFHRDVDNRCVNDRRCADQPSDPCGAGGECTEQDGVIACECAQGYEGPRCTLCADRYQPDELGRCLPVFSGGAMMLDAGMEQPKPTTCERGYTGPTCESCKAGYHEVADSCVLDDTCRPTSCPLHAVCSVAGGATQCTCETGYTEAGCSACAPAYHREDGACVPDESCVADTCPTHSTCAVQQGQAICTCDLGYRGEDCASCAVGYETQAGVCVIANCPSGTHKQGTACVPDEFCELNSCPEHATCAVAAGEITCPCDPGWGPTGSCDLCSGYATERASFEYPDWPKTDNNCVSRNELAVSRISFVSRRGPTGPEGKVLLCARSTFSKMSTQHIELQTYANRPAVLTFEEPAILVAFDYGTRVQPLKVDVYAHDAPSTDMSTGGRLVGSLDLVANSRSTFTISLQPAARALSLRSRTGGLQDMALDDLVYSYPNCK